jgi:hypothetical protein
MMTSSIQLPPRRPGLDFAAGQFAGNVHADRQFQIPADLREWIAPSMILAWVEEEVASLNWDHPQVAEHLRLHRDDNPRTWLVLLAYSYATGTLLHDQIIRACRLVPEYRCACGGQVPFTHELRFFRRTNRRLIEYVLAGVFLRALQTVSHSAASMPLVDLTPKLRSTAADRINLARHMDSED